jgi:NADH dehydrogenase [ubiquinone] 1 alpha subcomplex assembly factor 2
MEEQARDVVRVREVQARAALADERWRSGAMRRGLEGDVQGRREAGRDGGEEGEKEKEKEKEDPWKRARRSPGEEFQPASWGGKPTPVGEKKTR